MESRLATLNTASPRELVLMAVFDGDIEQEMHQCLMAHRERLEWFRYNDDVETTIIARMTPTTQWFTFRGEERKRRRRSLDADQMGPVKMDRLSKEQRDAIGAATRAGMDCFGALFGIPDEATLAAVIGRAQKDELLATRRLLSACGERVRAELDSATTDGSYDRFKVASFARTLLKNWRRRIGLELGAIMSARTPNDLS